MSTKIVICTDGSELASQAATEGLALLRPAEQTYVVTVVESADLAMNPPVSGFAGGGVSAEEYDRGRELLLRNGRELVERTVAQIGSADAEQVVLEGDPGAALCSFADEVGADAIVMGSRGRGGVKRALLGSVSDYVVRHAPCPVVITNPRG